MENPTDYVVTTESINKIEEYSRPDSGYEVLVGIPAAFTPVCAEEMDQLNKSMVKMIPSLTLATTNGSLTIVMLDNPHSVQAWLRDNKWENLRVLVSEYCAEANDMTTGDKDRPMQRTVVVNYYEPREAANEIESSFKNMFVGLDIPEPKYATKHELLRYQTAMEIPRNFKEIGRVIEHHAENKLG